MPARSPAGCAATSLARSSAPRRPSSAVLAAMSGPPSGDGPVPRPVTWEGQAVPPRSRRRRAAAPPHRARKTGRRAARRARSISPRPRARWPPTRSRSATSSRSSTKLTAAVDGAPAPRSAATTTRRRRPACRPAPNAHEALRKADRGADQGCPQQGRQARRRGRPSRCSNCPTRCSPTSCCRSRTPRTSAIPTAPCCSPRTSRGGTTSGSTRATSETRLRAAWAVPRVEVTPGRPVARQRLAARPRHRAGAAGAAPAQLRARARSAEADVERARHASRSASRS